MSDDAYFRHVHVRIPAGLPWDLGVAYSLMVGIFALPTVVTLAIRFMHSAIEWYIEVPSSQVESLTRTLYRYYPSAVLTAISPPPPAEGRFRFMLYGSTPFIASIMTVDMFQRLDPLPALLNAGGGLSPSESILLEAHLTPAASTTLKLGKQLATQSLTSWTDFLSVGGTLAAAVRKLRGADRAPAYVPELQRLIETKLNSPLRETALSLTIQSPTAKRAGEILNNFEPAFALFDRVGGNNFVGGQQGVFPLVLSPAEVAGFWHLPNEQCRVSGIHWVTAQTAPLPTGVSSSEEGITLGWSEYQGVKKEVRISPTDRVTHINIIGRTGMGKSTLLHHLIHQDIAAGRGVAVIDPHGDLVKAVLDCSIPPERESDVILFDTTDTRYPLGLNLLDTPDGVTAETVASQAVGVLRKMFADSWNPSRMEDSLYAAIMSLVSIEGATVQDIPRLFLNSQFRAQVIQQVSDPVALDFWLDEYEPLSPAFKAEFARPIASRIRRFYRHPEVRRIVCQKESLDFGEAIRGSKIFLANLQGIQNIEADTVGALLISKIQIAGMSQLNRTKRAPFYLYIDEVQNFTTTSLAQMFSEARKYNLTLAVANQFLRQLEGETLDAVLGNAGTTVLFRLNTPDALPLSVITRPYFSLEDLSGLNRFTAVVKLQSQGTTQPAFGITLNPPVQRQAGSRDQLERIRSRSRAQYGKSAEDVDAEIASRYMFPNTLMVAPETDEREEDSYFG
jgi:hypothetical protein